MRPEPPIFQCETLAWLFLICDMPLPVAGEIDALTALHCRFWDSLLSPGIAST
jgi:hypothetical protein